MNDTRAPKDLTGEDSLLAVLHEANEKVAAGVIAPPADQQLPSAEALFAEAAACGAAWPPAATRKRSASTWWSTRMASRPPNAEVDEILRQEFAGKRACDLPFATRPTHRFRHGVRRKPHSWRSACDTS